MGAKRTMKINVEGSEREDTPNTDFGNWVDSVGGVMRVCRILGVNKTTLWRQMEKDKPSPIYLAMMKLSLKNADLVKENDNLKKELDKLKNG